MIKWLFKWLLRLALLVIVLIVLFVVFKDSVLTRVTERRIRLQTGMDVRIGKLSTSLLSSVVTVQNLKLYNTPEFGGKLFLDIPELYVEVDPLFLSRNRLRLKLVRVNLAELDIVRNEAGRTNITSFIEKQPSLSSGYGTNKLEKLLGGLEFDGIDLLKLSFGKARFIDLKEPARNLEVKVGMENQAFKNVESEADTYAILFMIWLRSGGKFSVNPDDIAKDYMERKVIQIETSVRQTVEKPPKH
ncbi:MAG TPA: AsmA family protein [Candidatus Paceibacterota bacterium]|nr:AsmA family protein [Candidatus Paceibacterota bacterium]